MFRHVVELDVLLKAEILSALPTINVFFFYERLELFICACDTLTHQTGFSQVLVG